MTVYFIYIRFSGNDVFLDLASEYPEVAVDLMWKCHHDGYVFNDKRLNISYMVYAFTIDKVLAKSFLDSRKQQLFYCKKINMSLLEYEIFHEKYMLAEIFKKSLMRPYANPVGVTSTQYEYKSCNEESQLYRVFADSPCGLLMHKMSNSGEIFKIFSKKLQESLHSLGFDMFMQVEDSSSTTDRNITINQFGVFLKSFYNMLKD